MRTTHLCLLATCLAVSLVAASPATAADSKSDAAIKDAVLATNTAMIGAANRLDMDAFFDYIVDGTAIPVVQNGALFKTRQDAKDAVNRTLRGIVKVERKIDDPKVTVLGADAALLVGEGSVTATADDGRVMTATFAVSQVFVRRGSDWKLLHGHYSAPPRM